MLRRSRTAATRLIHPTIVASDTALMRRSVEGFRSCSFCKPKRETELQKAILKLLSREYHAKQASLEVEKLKAKGSSGG